MIKADFEVIEFESWWTDCRHDEGDDGDAGIGCASSFVQSKIVRLVGNGHYYRITTGGCSGRSAPRFNLCKPIRKSESGRRTLYF